MIGAVFEAATLVGVRLFDADMSSLTTMIRQADDTISLLPKHVQAGGKVVADEFPQSEKTGAPSVKKTALRRSPTGSR